MSALQEVLARAEQFEAGRAAEVARLTDSQQRIKAAVDEAKHDHRKAHGLVLRIRGVIEAVERLPEAAEILGDDPAPAAAESVLDGLGLRAGQDGEPPLVEVAPVAPFTPALDYPDSHPVEPPQRESNVRPIEAASAIKAITSAPAAVARQPADSSRPARPNGPKVQALGDQILAMFEKVRLGSTASLEMEAIYRATGKSQSQVSIALTNLAERGLIRRVKQAERGHVTVLIKDASGVAA